MEIGKKSCIAVDTTFYDEHNLATFGTVSHYEGNWAIIVRDTIPECPCCTQPMPNIRKVYR